MWWKYESIRIYDNTKKTLDELDVSIWWVSFKTYDDKINHLIWFFKHYKNWNSN